MTPAVRGKFLATGRSPVRGQQQVSGEQHQSLMMILFTRCHRCVSACLRVPPRRGHGLVVGGNKPTEPLLLSPSVALSPQVFFSVFFAFNYALEMLLSKNRIAHTVSLLGIVDVITTGPVFYAIVTGEIESSPTGFVRFYRVLMLTRVSGEKKDTKKKKDGKQKKSGLKKSGVCLFAPFRSRKTQRRHTVVVNVNK